jgi:hypothetical protein
MCLLINDVELILDPEETAPQLMRPFITLNLTHAHEYKPAVNHLKYCLLKCESQLPWVSRTAQCGGRILKNYLKFTFIHSVLANN